MNDTWILSNPFSFFEKGVRKDCGPERPRRFVSEEAQKTTGSIAESVNPNMFVLTLRSSDLMAIFFVLDGLRIEPTTESAGRFDARPGAPQGCRRPRCGGGISGVRGPQLGGRISSGSGRSMLSAPSFIEQGADSPLGESCRT